MISNGKKNDYLEKYKKTGTFKLSSGAISDEYYDIKEAMGETDNLDAMLYDIMYKKMKEKPQIIIGIEFGGIPLAVGLSLKLRIPFAILMKEKKDHGTEKRIEGFQGKGTVLLLDDVRTSGNTISDALVYLEKNGYTVTEWITVIERKETAS